MKKALPPEELVKLIPEGAVLMIGGFMGVGSPHRLIDALVESGQKNLTIIANDTAVIKNMAYGVVLMETALGVSVEVVLAATGTPLIVAKDVKPMNIDITA